jgi:catechol 2,3-dioxygenase-like lactoylglutathione lyase family enzyme
MIKGINGIHHVSLTVPDMQQALHFYRDALGFEQMVEVHWPPQGASAEDETTALLKKIHEINGDDEVEISLAILKVGNACLELFEFRKPKSPPLGPPHRTNVCGIRHFALDVSDLDDLYPRLLAAGVRFHAPPQHSPQVITTYGRDPFGNVIEFQELPRDSGIRLPGL